MIYNIALSVLGSPILYIALIILLNIALHSYLSLYRKKKNPKYPILPKEQVAYLEKNPVSFFRELPMSPLIIWKLIFKTHDDNELNSAANIVRILLLLFIGSALLNMLLSVLIRMH